THQLINNAHSANFNAPDFVNSFPTLQKNLQQATRNSFPSHVPYNSGIIFPEQYGPQRFQNQQFPSLIAHHAQTFQGTPRYKLTPERAAPLMDWFEKHKHHPYPSRMEKISLCEVTQLNYTQVSNWFANARRRMKQRHKVSEAGTPENK
ncbi:homeobox domain-containing protein, partial [Salmonella sp. s51228]|uniref:homeobox domain-containing protein n=1 Tax=Salmonella sp. s51228 TaxID=3159652 RepID=UPI0039808DAC